MTATPDMAVTDAVAAIAFYEDVFGADVFHIVRDEAGKKIVHARMRFDDDSVVYLHDSVPGELSGIVAPDVSGSTGVSVGVALATRAEVDRIFEAATAKGIEIVAEPKMESWGEYYRRLRDPFGHAWAFGTYEGTGTGNG